MPRVVRRGEECCAEWCSSLCPVSLWVGVGSCQLWSHPGAIPGGWESPEIPGYSQKDEKCWIFPGSPFGGLLPVL